MSKFKTCSIEECESRADSRGLCTRHYQRAYREGRIEEYPLHDAGDCEWGGCDKPHYAKGLCRAHHTKMWRRFGKPALDKALENWNILPFYGATETINVVPDPGAGRRIQLHEEMHGGRVVLRPDATMEQATHSLGYQMGQDHDLSLPHMSFSELMEEQDRRMEEYAKKECPACGKDRSLHDVDDETWRGVAGWAWMLAPGMRKNKFNRIALGCDNVEEE